MFRSLAIPAILLAVLAGPTPQAQADAGSALAALKMNAARTHAPFDIDFTVLEARPTLIKGIYGLSDMRHNGAGAPSHFTNETGTILGTAAGWKKLSPIPTSFRPDEIAEIRAEILDNIDFEKLIKLQYGDGGERRMLLFSAVDCPHCQHFEQSLRRAAPALNTTFYVLPLSLLGDDTAEGKQHWQTAANLWCARDNAGAWRAYWTNPTPIAGQRCAAPLPQPRNAYRALTALLASVGIVVNATPVIVREDGTLFFPQDSFAVKYAQDNFNPSVFAGMTIEAAGKARRWLPNDRP